MAEIYQWGLNNNGQLGNGLAISKNIPTLLSGIPPLPSTLNIDNIKLITSGSQHTALLTKDGFLYTCGYNYNGQLGNDSTSSSFTKNFELCTNVDDIQGTIKEVSCGTSHTMLLTNSGKIYGTGYNFHGPLGIGSTNNKTIFTLSTFNFTAETINSISCGSYFTVVLATSGNLYTTGNNSHGQLGFTYNNVPHQSFALCNSISNVEAVYAGQVHTMVLTKDGKVYGTGYNYQGGLGLNFAGQALSTFSLSTFNNDFPSEIVSSISSGGQHTLLLTKSGKTYVTGFNNYGQLGINSYQNVNKFTLCYDVNNIQGTIKAVYASLYNSLVITNDGVIYCCGLNNNGQLGDGSFSINNIYTPIVNTDINKNFSWVNSGCMNQTKFAYKEKPVAVINSITSSSLHLYDSINNDLYNVSTFSERIEHNSGSKPQHFHGNSVTFYNKDGTNTYSEVVPDLNVLKAGQVSDRAYTDASALTQATDRVAVNDSLTSLLNTATSSRLTADFILQNSITTNKAAVVASVASALASHISADAESKLSLDAEKATFTSNNSALIYDLTVEVARALASEQKESSECLASDVLLRADLTSEATRALESEQKEELNRFSADSSLISRIEQKINERINLVQVQRDRINAIIADNSVDLNKLKNIVDAYNGLDSKQANEITGLNATCVLLQTQITTLKSKLDLALTVERSMGKK